VELDAGVGSDDQRVRQVPCGDLRHRFARDDGSTSQDNTALVHMNDATILDNLQVRHSQDAIYTYTASVLLAMNPYKVIDGLYGDDQCAQYRGKHIGALRPHPYAIADTAYRALMRERKNQGLLISGESGAGKTETAKIVMQYLSYVSGSASDFAARIQGRVKQAQPILESFGNAATMRNNNSSRFGKYNRVFFNDAGALVDASVTTYLLESSRVVVHSERERNYHCFYEMLAGLSDEHMEEFGLLRAEHYCLLTAQEPVPGFEERDKHNFHRLCGAFKTIGLDDAGTHAFFQVLAGLVHLGETLSKDDEAEEYRILDDDHVEKAASLLGFETSELGAVLKRKKVKVPGRDSFHEVPRTALQSRHILHSLIKALYKRLFEQTVKLINESYRELQVPGTRGATDDADRRHIGILDIYGFEQLQKNSFEQLCINLANERLQQYFVENVLRAEQDTYKREGIPWCGLALPDSGPVITCITSVFRTLDVLSKNVSNGVKSTDEMFCDKVVKEAQEDPQHKNVLQKLKMSSTRRQSSCPAMNEGFTIKHYAGAVLYTTKGWLDKNNDKLLKECEELIFDSEFPLVKNLAEEKESQTSSRAAFKSISEKYIADLEALLLTLSTCNLHYIRCFKPNDVQKPDLFKPQLVLDQIVQCGTVELVKIMQDGFPNRCSFEEISQRFKALLPERFQHFGMRTFIEALMLAYDVPQDQYALGMSRLFLKAGQLRALEEMRSEGATADPEKLAMIVSGIIRKRWKRATEAIKLCNYIPTFISKIYQKRAAQKLTRLAVVTGRLAQGLEAAKVRIKERRLKAHRRVRGAFLIVTFFQSEWSRMKEKRKLLARRRLRGAFLGVKYVQSAWLRILEKRLEKRRLIAHRRLRGACLAVGYAQSVWKGIRQKRKDRMVDALFLASVVYPRSLRCLGRARESLREAEAERLRLEEEERRKEEERKAEEERLRQEQLRLEAERKAEEERQLQEQLRLEEEQKAEEERLAAEERQRQEELRLEEERLAAEEQRQEALRLEEERKAEEELERERSLKKIALLEEQVSALKEEKRRNSISQVASPQRTRTSLAPASLEEELKQAEQTPATPGQSSGDAGQSTGASSSGAAAEQDVSALVEKMKAEYEAKEKQVQLQMEELLAKNAALEEREAERMAAASAAQEAAAQEAAAQETAKAKAIEDRNALQTTPPSDTKHSTQKPSRSKARMSLPSSSSALGLPSEGKRKARRSIAHEAFLTMQDDLKGGTSPSPPPQVKTRQRRSTAACTGADRKSEVAWQAQLRGFLIEDLWPSPGGGEEDGSTERRRSIRRASRVPSAAPIGEDEAAVAQPVKGRDLNEQFAIAEETEVVDTRRESSRSGVQFSWRQRNSCGPADSA